MLLSSRSQRRPPVSHGQELTRKIQSKCDLKVRPLCPCLDTTQYPGVVHADQHVMPWGWNQ